MKKAREILGGDSPSLQEKKREENQRHINFEIEKKLNDIFIATPGNALYGPHILLQLRNAQEEIEHSAPFQETLGTMYQSTLENIETFLKSPIVFRGEFPKALQETLMHIRKNVDRNSWTNDTTA